mmetsp:Transcript_33163/g.91681  ORF Transcript_33163/g.91681 Transcript_33163/m.91681 type:complete len:183 (-) Transcript_33163:120-668(-)
MVPLPGSPGSSKTQEAPARPRERLDLDPDRPPFLLLTPTPGTAGGGSGASAAQQLKKPRIGPVESSGALASARAFLAMAGGSGPTTDLPQGGCDPEIALVVPAPVRLPGEPPEAEGQPTDGQQHVQMEVGLGLFDVGGSPEALLRSGVPEAAGHLPCAAGGGAEEEDEVEAPLIQEVTNAAA